MQKMIFPIYANRTSFFESNLDKAVFQSYNLRMHRDVHKDMYI